MNDIDPSNLPELSVSELSTGIKRTIETSFDYVRVRGELGRVTLPRSGHLYADLKDDKSVISIVMFKNMMGRVSFQPEQGLEVIVEGRVTAYPGQSKYQILAKKILPAGEGALMALLEKRKKLLMAEGLMDASRKRPLPFLPKTIGVVTSPTGAVLRDILHRLRDRLPRRVIVWPSLVQGENAAAQVARGIKGLNALEGGNRPNVIIVARGGGSLEDLWAFNEEVVARAAAASKIPLVSAIGHETDTSLLDMVADVRAPTPTGAAEMVVPVRDELLAYLAQVGQRSKGHLHRYFGECKTALKGLALPPPTRVLLPYTSRYEVSALKLKQAPLENLQKARTNLSSNQLTPALVRTALGRKQRAFITAQGAFRLKAGQATAKANASAQRIFSHFRPELMTFTHKDKREKLKQLNMAMQAAISANISRGQHATQIAGGLLEALSHKATLARGYAIVRDTQGTVVRSDEGLKEGQPLRVSVAHGEFGVKVDSKTGEESTKGNSSKLNEKKPPSAKTSEQQGRLI